MSVNSNTVHHELESLRAKISLDLEYAPIASPDVGIGVFSVATTSAVLTLLAQLDEATSEHPKFRRKRPIDIATRHDLGAITGRLTIDAHLCPAGMLMVRHFFGELLPTLISEEIAMRAEYARSFSRVSVVVVR